jgi:heat shock protein HtpX
MVYQDIAANKRRSWIIVFAFVAVMAALGWGLGQITDYGPAFLPLALIVSGAMSLVGYYSGDKIALAAAGAKEVSKEQNPYLCRIVENLSIAAGLPAPKVYIIPSPAINAFATGRDPQHSSIAVTSGAIEKLENEELEGVLAHELSHVGNYDTRLMALVLVLVGSIGLLANWGTRSMFFGGGRRDSRDSGGQGLLMILGILLLILAPIAAQLMRFAVSRRREYLADASAALLTRYPEGLARALEKIAAGPALETANAAVAPLFIASPFGNAGRKVANLFSTHPPVAERIKRLRAMMA